jgi:hypothetical protein
VLPLFRPEAEVEGELVQRKVSWKKSDVPWALKSWAPSCTCAMR